MRERPGPVPRHNRGTPSTGMSRLCCNGGMCTAVLSVEPGAPVLLAGGRDGLVDRAWQAPGQDRPDSPGVVGGPGLLAGGTARAAPPAARRGARGLNRPGAVAPPA